MSYHPFCLPSLTFGDGSPYSFSISFPSTSLSHFLPFLRIVFRSYFLFCQNSARMTGILGLTYIYSFRDTIRKLRSSLEARVEVVFRPSSNSTRNSEGRHEDGKERKDSVDQRQEALSDILRKHGASFCFYHP